MNVSKLPFRQVHLDFHTSECIDNIGSLFDKENFKRCLKKGHIDSITCLPSAITVGPTFLPKPMKCIRDAFRPLSAELETCAEAGVAAPIYISAGFDEKYAVNHPEDLVIWEKDGHAPKLLEKDGHKYFENGYFNLICMNSPYLKVLEAQTKEVVEKFHPVGVFFDIVAPRICWCERCKL